MSGRVAEQERRLLYLPDGFGDNDLSLAKAIILALDLSTLFVCDLIDFGEAPPPQGPLPPPDIEEPDNGT